MSPTTKAQKDKIAYSTLYVETKEVNFLHVESKIVTRGWELWWGGRDRERLTGRYKITVRRNKL